MSKINQIQNALKELDGGTFQKLAESYLHKKGYDQINCIGSVLGNNKVRKGTPDTLVALPNGKYTFAEHTTTIKGVCSKFSDDIDKCFDEDKTGIKTSEIEEIILCFTERLTSEEQALLTRKCSDKNVNIIIFGISEISYDLLERYQSIALDHLGIEIDTGQIVDIEKFLKLYNANKLTTSLSNNLYFRKNDKDLIKQSVLDNDLTIISGQAGIGKSRLAIECYKELVSSDRELKAYCIFNKGIDLFNDIKTYFSDSGDYLIFVDDANRVSGFQYILQQLQDKRTDQSFKIIVTVRDYALEKIKNSSEAYASFQECYIGKLKDEEITNILRDEFDIQNHLYLERICHISDGNPRIAVMAAKIAKESNALGSISDVSQIYDNYFQSIKEDLEEFNESQIMETAGIISYFRTVDLCDEKHLDLIKEIFGISNTNFKSSCKSLHEMEVVDMYENEVVKISDQVLATYLFYLVFLKEQKLKFSPLVNELFSSNKRRLLDALNPALSAFDQEYIINRIKPDIDSAWNQKLAAGDEEFIQLMDVFWFIKPTETLMYVQNKIDDGSVNDTNINYKNEFMLHSYLSVLSSFIHLSDDYTGMAIDLYLKYLEKFPKSLPLIQDAFSTDFIFDCDSHLYGYSIQKIVIDKLVSKSRNSKNDNFKKLFISTACSFSQTNYSTTRAGRGNTVTWREFSLLANKELLSIRSCIFNYIVQLFNSGVLKEKVIEYLFQFSIQYGRYDTPEIDKHDAGIIIPFLLSSLAPNCLTNCVISNSFYQKFRGTDLTCLNDLKRKFDTPLFKLYDCFFTKLENAEMRLKKEEFIRYKSKKILKIISSFTLKTFQDFFSGLTDIFTINEQNNSWQLERGFEALLDSLSSSNNPLYEEVLLQVLVHSKQYRISVFHIVNDSLSILGKKNLLKLLNSRDYENKALCINAFYANLDESDITEEDVKSLINIFNFAPHNSFYLQLAHLKKYDKKIRGTFKDIVEIIVERTSKTEDLGRLLESLFNEHFFTEGELKLDFDLDNSLIEKCYIYADKSCQHFDYNGEKLARLLDINLNFMSLYLTESENEKGRRDDNRDYSFIWNRTDHAEIMELVNQHFLHREYKWGLYREFKVFYNKGVHAQANTEITSTQDDYLKSLIKSDFNNDELMSLIFDLICDFEKERKLELYKTYLSLGTELNSFKNLRLYPSGMSSEGGSFVPVIARRKEFVQELAESCDTIELLSHRSYLENEINNLREDTQRYMKRDFTEDNF